MNLVRIVVFVLLFSLLYVEASAGLSCNGKGMCETTCVTVIGAKLAELQWTPLPTPTPGKLGLQIIYPTDGSTVPAGSVTARATANVSGGYGRVINVDFYITTWDPYLAAPRTVCSGTTSSPNSENEYTYTCTLSEGKYTLTVWASDSNHNLKVESVTFTVSGSGDGEEYISETMVYVSPLTTLKAEEGYDFKMPQSFTIDTGIIEVIVKPAETTDVQIRIEKLKELPSEIPKPEGMLVAILSIELTTSKPTALAER